MNKNKFSIKSQLINFQTKKFIIILFCLVFLSACGFKPSAGVIPTFEEVAKRRENPTPQQAFDYCRQKGGHYEDWLNEDKTRSTFCILPEGYGCDPELFYKGTCGMN